MEWMDWAWFSLAIQRTTGLIMFTLEPLNVRLHTRWTFTLLQSGHIAIFGSCYGFNMFSIFGSCYGFNMFSFCCDMVVACVSPSSQCQ